MLTTGHRRAVVGVAVLTTLLWSASSPAGAQAANALPVIAEVAKSATGAPPRTVGIIMDNTASPVAFTKPMREGGFDKLGMKLVVDEIYTPPLSDATSMVQKVRNARPDLLLLLSAADSRRQIRFWLGADP